MLKFNDKYLKNLVSLEDSELSDQCVVLETSNYKGKLLTTSQVNNQVTHFDNKKAESYQTCVDGLNIIGICENTLCKAFKKEICIGRGFGVFDFPEKDNYYNRCP